MSDPKLHKDDREKTQGRNLPSWMNPNESQSNSHRKKQVDASSWEKAHEHKKAGIQSTKNHSGNATEASPDFLKLLEDVIIVLSGFVNPERSTLRSQALEMGAEYRSDWTSDCTLLVCAFPNTPKFRQVEADCGTIVSKDWIAECYNQKKLVEIDKYLMHAGKPWRKNGNVPECNRGNNMSGKVVEQLVRKTPQMMVGSSMAESETPKSLGNHFSPSEVKEWAIIDLTATVSWLEKQEEKPEQDEIKKIATEGIITCLQDAIEALDHNQDIQSVTDQWMFIPRVVKELAELDGRTRKGSLTKEELSKLALDCKHVYEEEYYRSDDHPVKSKKHKGAGYDYDGQEQKVAVDDEGFDSDSTIEMTEEEIDLAYRAFSCS